MYGTSDGGADEASTPPNCPACQGKTYYVDPEQTVITCYDCGRYFRRKKEDASQASATPAAPASPEPPVPPVPVAPDVPEIPAPPPPPSEPVIPAPLEPAPHAAEPPVPVPPVYEPPPPPPVIPVPPPLHASVPEPPAEEEGDFDLVISETAEEPLPALAPEVSGEPVGCSVCGFPMDPAWKVCPNCVSRYETQCDSCGRTLQAWWLICPWCETPKKPDHIHTGQ